MDALSIKLTFFPIGFKLLPLGCYTSFKTLYRAAQLQMPCLLRLLSFSLALVSPAHENESDWDGESIDMQ